MRLLRFLFFVFFRESCPPRSGQSCWLYALTHIVAAGDHKTCKPTVNKSPRDWTKLLIYLFIYLFSKSQMASKSYFLICRQPSAQRPVYTGEAKMEHYRHLHHATRSETDALHFLWNWRTSRSVTITSPLKKNTNGINQIPTWFSTGPSVLVPHAERMLSRSTDWPTGRCSRRRYTEENPGNWNLFTTTSVGSVGESRARGDALSRSVIITVTGEASTQTHTHERTHVEEDDRCRWLHDPECCVRVCLSAS